MPYYHKLGNIPHKRHTQFHKQDGGLYSEQLFSTEGLSNDYSLMYHVYPPTQIIKTEPQISVAVVLHRTSPGKLEQYKLFGSNASHADMSLLN